MTAVLKPACWTCVVLDVFVSLLSTDGRTPALFLKRLIKQGLVLYDSSTNSAQASLTVTRKTNFIYLTLLPPIVLQLDRNWLFPICFQWDPLWWVVAQPGTTVAADLHIISFPCGLHIRDFGSTFWSPQSASGCDCQSCLRRSDTSSNSTSRCHYGSCCVNNITHTTYDKDINP